MIDERFNLFLKLLAEMGGGRRPQYSRAELVKLLKEADIPSEAKEKVEAVLKYAMTGCQTRRKLRLMAVVGDYLTGMNNIAQRFLEGKGEIRLFGGSHSLIVGSPGTGKTLFCMKQAATIKEDESERDTTLIWGDVEGDVSRRMPSLIKPESGKLIVLTRDKIRLNLFELAETTDSWLGVWPKTLSEPVFMGEGSDLLLTRVGRQLAQAEVVRRMGGHATFYEIRQALSRMSVAGNPELKRYKNVTEHRLETLEPTLGPIFNHRYGYPPDMFRGKCVVYDLSWLGSVEQVAMQVFLLNYFWCLAACGVLGKTIFVYEELHRTYRSAANREMFTEPSYLNAARSSRKDNFFVWFVDHSTAAAPDDLLYCADSKVIFRMTQYEDIRDAEKYMLLSSELAARIPSFKNQQVLLYIGGRMEAPELHHIPNIPYRDYSIEEVTEMMKPYVDSLPFVAPDGTGAPSAPGQVLSFLGPNRNIISEFLRTLIEHPTESVGAIMKAAGIAMNESNINRAAEAVLIAWPEKLQFGRVGAGKGLSMHYTEILPAGAEFIQRDYEEVRLRGGKNKSLRAKIATNCIFENRCARYEQPEQHVFFESKGADVLELAGDGCYCYEYESAVHPHITENVLRDLREARALQVYVIMDSKTQLDEAKALLKAALSEEDFNKLLLRQSKEYL